MKYSASTPERGVVYAWEGEVAGLRAEIERLRRTPEELALMIEGFSADQIRMTAGEMTAQEMRTVRAVQRWWASAIRVRAAVLNQQKAASDE